jgi:hypothetical protein
VHDGYQQLTPYLATRSTGGRYRVTVGAFLFLWRGVAYRIPSCFEWNGASIPRVLHWWECSFADWLVIPSAIHDYLYRFHHSPREAADRCFLAAMHYQISISGKSRKWQARKLKRARIIYAAVRAFGAAWW